jgi:hypothetical protein
MKRYTITVTRPVEAADVREDENGAWVNYSEVEAIYRRLGILEARSGQARGILGGAFVGPINELREKIAKALEALEGKR